MTPKTITCLNGQFVYASRASIPVADRGFRFGDGVFETIRIARGVPYQWEFHLTRLMQGLAALRITPPPVDLADYARITLHKNKAVEGYLRIAVSRGVGSRGYLPFPPGMQATWVIEYLAPVPAPDAPAQLWLSSSARVPPQCLPVQMKLAQGLASTLAMLEAQDHGCDEALQLTTSGHICEAASANLFWLKDEQLFTPSLEVGCLNGSTREAILRLSPIPVRMVVAGLSELEHVDAIFLTNCRVGVWPAASVQPRGLAFNASHPILATLADLLDADRAATAKRERSAWVKA